MKMEIDRLREIKTDRNKNRNRETGQRKKRQRTKQTNKQTNAEKINNKRETAKTRPSDRHQSFGHGKSASAPVAVHALAPQGT